MLDKCLQICSNVYTPPQGANKGDKMPEMDFTHSAILEGYWQGFDAWEIADKLGEDVDYVARIMDDFRGLGY